MNQDGKKYNYNTKITAFCISQITANYIPVALKICKSVYSLESQNMTSIWFAINSILYKAL